MSGSLEASKIPCLLFQLLVSISSDGLIIPNDLQWSKDHGIIHRNATDVIMKAGCMALELVLFFKVQYISNKNLQKLQMLISSTVEHVNILFDFKNSLLNNKSFFGGIKIHALFHTLEQIQWNGIPDVTDTMVFERAHCEDAVELFQQSSKRNSTQLIEITNMLLERRYARLMSSRIQKQDEKNSSDNLFLRNLLNSKKNKVQNSFFEDTSFQRVSNLGKCILLFKNGTWIKKNPIINCPLHPYFALSKLNSLLLKYCRLNINIPAQQAIQCLMKNSTTTDYRLQLEFGIKIVPSTESGMDTSLLYATNNFVAQRSNDVRASNKISRHDSVELGDIGNEKDYQHILGIISVIQLFENGDEKSLAVLIIGAAYSMSKKTRYSKLLPYPELKYKINSSTKTMDITIFQIDDVKRPICIIPQRQFWDNKNEVMDIPNIRMCF
jgi:hypothetical protein